MGEGQEKMLQSPCTARGNDDSYETYKDQWVILGGGGGGGGGEDDTGNTSSLDNPSSTNGSTASSLDMVDDDASSCSSSNSNGPLFELSELLSHLPIKRGLSKYYEGKSQSFTSLSRVASMEDLAKKETGCRRKMKGSKSYANGLDFHKSYRLPKPVIAKKVSSRGSMPSFCFPDRRGSFLNRARPPPIPLRKKFRCITS